MARPPDALGMDYRCPHDAMVAPSLERCTRGEAVARNAIPSVSDVRHRSLTAESVHRGD